MSFFWQLNLNRQEIRPKIHAKTNKEFQKQASAKLPQYFDYSALQITKFKKKEREREKKNCISSTRWFTVGW